MPAHASPQVITTHWHPPNPALARLKGSRRLLDLPLPLCLQKSIFWPNRLSYVTGSGFLSPFIARGLGHGAYRAFPSCGWQKLNIQNCLDIASMVPERCRLRPQMRDTVSGQRQDKECDLPALSPGSLKKSSCSKAHPTHPLTQLAKCLKLLANTFLGTAAETKLNSPNALAKSPLFRTQGLFC